VGCRIESC